MTNDLKGYRYPIAFVGFGGLPRFWWMRFLKKGFYHCFIILGNGYRWILIDSLSHFTDAIILKNMCREVTLRSETSSRYVKVSYPQMPYLGIWHWPKTDAPYVCIEPWSSLPARQEVVEEISCKSDLIHLLPGKTYENTWTITIGEDTHD